MTTKPTHAQAACLREVRRREKLGLPFSAWCCARTDVWRRCHERGWLRYAGGRSEMTSEGAQIADRAIKEVKR